MRYRDKWPEYAKQWNKMTIKSDRIDEFNHYAKKLIEHKDRYLTIEKLTEVMWYHIAVIHLRESDADFNTYLGNGDPLNRPTRHVPKNRGPFKSFEDGAVDALKLDGLIDIQDWRLEKILYYCEIFNGTGYNNRDLPSPYLWGGTNIQKPGKYVSDGKFNPKSWDTQPGVAPILFSMAELDNSIQFIREN